MKLLLQQFVFSLITLSGVMAQEIEVTLVNESKVSNEGLYFDGVRGVDYQFGPRITPHGDCIDVINGYVFVTWYKGGMDKRNLMLSRKKIDDPGATWVTIQFPDRHIGYRGDPTIGDSHNTAAVGVSPIDGTVHLLYDMHSYSKASYPNNYFNYRISAKNAAFVPDSEFNISLFNDKRFYLKEGEQYQFTTYPAFNRDDNGNLMVRFRYRGSGNGEIKFATYNGTSWSGNTLFSDGTIPLPDRYSLYGSEKFLNGKLYSGFSIRYAQDDNYTNNSGLYFAYANPPYSANDWYDLNGNNFSLPIGKSDFLQFADPSLEYGTTTAPKMSYGPAFTVTESGAVHFVTRVDNLNVHYYKAAGESSFSSAAGGAVPKVTGEIFSINKSIIMVDLQGGYPVVKVTPEGTNQWETRYLATEGPKFNHLNAVMHNGKLYVYLMESVTGDARPLHLQVYEIKEFFDGSVDVPANIRATEYLYEEKTKLVAYDSNTYVAMYPNSRVDYLINVPKTGIYEIQLQAAAQAHNLRLEVALNQEKVLRVDTKGTKGKTNWKIISDLIPLQEGKHTLSILGTQGSAWSLDAFEIKALDIEIEAEDYNEGGEGVGYHDFDSGNRGGVYRNDDVDIYANAAASNGHYIGHFKGGDWMKYTFTAPADGIYELTYYAANRNRDDAFINIEVDGNLSKNLTVTRTFDWNLFLSSSLPGIALTKGEHTIKITQRKSLSNNPDKIKLVVTGSSTPSETRLAAQQPDTIEAEAVLYPNPSTGIFYIKNKYPNASYAISRMDGSVIASGAVSEEAVDISVHPKGIYIVKISSEGNVVTQKIIRQ